MLTKLKAPAIGLAALLLLSLVFSNATSAASAAIATPGPDVGMVPAKPPGPAGNSSFPVDNTSWSPDARFLIKNANNVDQKTPYSIFLIDMKTGSKTLVYQYARKVDILWSPTSDAFVLNDWGSGDDGQTTLFRILPKQAHWDLREQLMKSTRPDAEKKLAANRQLYDHNFAHVMRWMNAHSVLFEIEGHSSDQQHKFVLQYVYSVGDSFQLKKRVAN